MSENEHVTSIRKLTRRIGVGILTAPKYSYVDGDADKDMQAVAAIDRHAAALARDLAEAEHQRDYHRDDAAAVRRERDAEINRLAGELAKAEGNVELLQQTCWPALKLNAQVTTKRESDPGYYDGVERLIALVTECEKKGLLPPPVDLPNPGEGA